VTFTYLPFTQETVRRYLLTEGQLIIPLMMKLYVRFEDPARTVQ